MKRREFITILGAGLAGAPLAGHAQADRMRRLGVLMSTNQSDPVAQARVAAFRDGLAQLGWNEGRNLAIEWRWSGGDLARTREYAAELVSLAPDVLLSNGTPATAALKQATTTIPIVFAVVNDPVAQGFIANMARPGGNITGFSFLEYSMVGKSLEMLKQIAPKSTHVAVLFNPDTYPYYEIHLKSFEAVAKQLSLDLSAAPARNATEVDNAIAKLGREPGSTLLVTPDPFMLVHRDVVIRAAAKHRVPASYSYRQNVKEGGLTSYGADATDIFFRSASYIDRILKGASPGDLPAQAPVKFEIAINVKTAKALGLDIPTDLLVLADEVIE
ncbi:ABC transporter substrate-binding protein [Bradyrhizobium canariense]|uniref:Putative ABC transport system substrate-binding protein n=1 Tax=Bradyrhizobium canariense TaxID=255045 RepID=A0A1H1YWV4_9BRAD|nr:ABC transporter substrate-binding protein [Bradyrhizobium canariense]SDT25920.1 putative ABC transport system substrate-binding protein [Bradyrhizobium canariense]